MNIRDYEFVRLVIWYVSWQFKLQTQSEKQLLEVLDVNHKFDNTHPQFHLLSECSKKVMLELADVPTQILNQEIEEWKTLFSLNKQLLDESKMDKDEFMRMKILLSLKEYYIKKELANRQMPYSESTKILLGLIPIDSKSNQEIQIAIKNFDNQEIKEQIRLYLKWTSDEEIQFRAKKYIEYVVNYNELQEKISEFIRQWIQVPIELKNELEKISIKKQIAKLLSEMISSEHFKRQLYVVNEE